MLSVKVAGTNLGAARQLTFIKQAVKRQIAGLYGFIMPATQDHSPGLRGEGFVLGVERRGECWQDSMVLVEICCPIGCHHVRVCSGQGTT